MRSASPADPSNGVLFRFNGASATVEMLGMSVPMRSSSVPLEEIPRGMGSRPIMLGGRPLPPPSLDYGFGLVSRSTAAEANAAELLMMGRSSRLRSNTFHLSNSDSELVNGISGADSSSQSQPFSYEEGSMVVGRSGTPHHHHHHHHHHHSSSSSLAKSGLQAGRRGRRPGQPAPPTPRMCISCGATKTPYWREAWSPTVLLCNACGLRFSKFRRRCIDCSYVPRKEDKGSRICTKCNGNWS